MTDPESLPASLAGLPYSLYLHIPFCCQRCSYCDFNTYAGLDALIPAYVTALCGEINFLGAGAEERFSRRLPVHTVFLGGGTPSLLPLGELERIFTAVREAFDLLPEVEISLEANPGTLDRASLAGLRGLGVNRLSLGMQSAHADELDLLGRIHTFEDVVQAVEWARQAGFDNLNLDAIFGLPGQPLERWEATLRYALALGVEHLSLYALTLEESTPLLAQVQAGQLPQPDGDLAADMYDLATELLGGAGFQQYEISNWAKHAGNSQSEVENPSYACRHNLQYWRNQPYLGIGAGAHGYIRMSPSPAPSPFKGASSSPSHSGAWEERAGASGYAGGMRIANVLAPAEYIQRMGALSETPSPVLEPTPSPALPQMQSTFGGGGMFPLHRISDDGEGWGGVIGGITSPDTFPQSPAAAQVTPLSVQDEMGETMMMGLRLTREGVSREVFQQRFGRDLTDVFGAQIERLIGLGLLEWAGPGSDVLRLTRRARFVANQVFVEFI